MSLKVEIPDRLAVLLKQRAHETGKLPADVVLEIVEKELSSTTAGEPMTERERVIAALRDGEFLSEISPDLVKRYVKPRRREERENILKHLQQISFSPTLSEMIIRDRDTH